MGFYGHYFKLPFGGNIFGLVMSDRPRKQSPKVFSRLGMRIFLCSPVKCRSGEFSKSSQGSRNKHKTQNLMKTYTPVFETPPMLDHL